MARDDRDANMTNVREQDDLRALLQTLEKPCDPRVTRSGYDSLSTFMQDRAARR
ncbi:MAG: hypothetical protein WA906_03980 [Pacificimonas sp.]